MVRNSTLAQVSRLAETIYWSPGMKRTLDTQCSCPWKVLTFCQWSRVSHNFINRSDEQDTVEVRVNESIACRNSTTLVEIDRLDGSCMPLTQRPFLHTCFEIPDLDSPVLTQ